jgi:hypothetical protein
MKKLLIFTLMIILSVLFSSCGDEQSYDNWKPAYVAHYKGCEYLLDGYRLSHSGTCSNPIHPENWTKEMWREKLQLNER